MHHISPAHSLIIPPSVLLIGSPRRAETPLDLRGLLLYAGSTSANHLAALPL